MNTDLIVLFACAFGAWWLSGARSFAYLLYYVSFVPFVTLDSTAGGLQTADGLSSDLVQTKMAVRLIASVAIALLLIRRRSALSRLADPRFLPVIVFVSWAFLGLAVRSDSLLPAMRLGELVTFALLGLLLWSESARGATFRSILRWHALALLPLIAITLIGAVTHPELAMHVGQDGLVRMGNRLINAETLGTVGALLLLWSSAELRQPREYELGWWRERALPCACIVLAVLTVLFARSRTAMIAAVIGEAVIWVPLFGGTRRQWITSLSAGCLVLVLVATQADQIETWFLRGQGVADLRTGTGRTELWAHLIDDAVPAHPVLGNGYLRLSEHGNFQHAGSTWSNAHNTYLAALLYCGIPGLIALLFLLWLPLRSAVRHLRDRCGDRGPWTLLLAWSTLTVISCATSFGICGWPNPLMLFFFALYPICVCAPRTTEDDAYDGEFAYDDHEDDGVIAEPAGT